MTRQFKMFETNAHVRPIEQTRLHFNEPTEPAEPSLGLFTGADVIHTYSRLQAIEDGVLVQLSGHGYEGDDWVPEMVAEAGFRIPLAMTVEAFSKYVDLTPAAKRAGNDLKGRLWDVLWMFRHAIARGDGRSEIVFEFRCVVDRIRPSRCFLKSICGPGDDGEPVITIMERNQD